MQNSGCRQIDVVNNAKFRVQAGQVETNISCFWSRATKGCKWFSSSNLVMFMSSSLSIDAVYRPLNNRALIFKRLWSPGIDSKE
jgi:hypothetical protein